MKNTKLLTLVMVPFLFTSCLEEGEPRTASGSVSKKTVDVKTDADGWTVEQKNIAKRLERDNIAHTKSYLDIIISLELSFGMSN